VIPSARIARTATAITHASAIVRVLLVEAGVVELVLVDPPGAADVGPAPLPAVVATAPPTSEVVSAAFDAGSATNPLAEQYPE
jgi:hypothetical protein